MNISIIGLGYVGIIDMACFASFGHRVIGVDISLDKVNAINDGKTPIVEKDLSSLINKAKKANLIAATSNIDYAIKNTDITFISVDTPYIEGIGLNMNNFYNVIKELAKSIKEKSRYHVIVVRSTVTPGTIKKTIDIINLLTNLKNGVDYSIVINPELLREGSAINDFFNPPYILIGSDDIKSKEIMCELYKDIKTEIIIDNTSTIEPLKLINNTYHALKVSFANEVGNICNSIDVDSHRVMEIFCKDTKLNISPYYFRPGFAYGGSCLPKDLNALKEIAHQNSIEIPIIDNIEKSNEAQKEKALDLILSKNKQKIGILGLSFKEGTDDLRSSPIINVIENLIKKGLEVYIFDANIKTLDSSNDFSKYIYNDINFVCNKSDVIVISNTNEEYYKILDNYNNKYVIDLVGKYRNKNNNEFYETIN